ncbi:MAG: hypothetical protein ABIN61_01105 [candidate division WOR-3 bacterium]
MGFLAYHLLYVQIPLIIFEFPQKDLREFSWVNNTPSIGLYSYKSDFISQFPVQRYINRTILGEDDIFLISLKEEYDTIPYSCLRIVNGDYKLLQFYFERKLTKIGYSGGIFGSGEILRGFGSISFPFLCKTQIVTSIYGDVLNFSLSSDYLYFETTKENWWGYLKIGDGRLGLTYDDRAFFSYLVRVKDPIFLVMINFVGEGFFKEGRVKVKSFSIAPIYIFSLNNSIYFLFQRDPAIGFKSKYGDFEFSKNNCLLAINNDFLKAFINYSFKDYSFEGALLLNLRYPLYNRRITPEAQITFCKEDLDLKIGLKILEVRFFYELTGLKYDGNYNKQFWGIETFFSF